MSRVSKFHPLVYLPALVLSFILSKLPLSNTCQLSPELAGCFPELVQLQETDAARTVFGTPGGVMFLAGYSAPTLQGTSKHPGGSCLLLSAFSLPAEVLSAIGDA